MALGRCIHWSGVGCTYPDDEASLVPQKPEYYTDDCPRKCGGGCAVNGYLEDEQGEEVA